MNQPVSRLGTSPEEGIKAPVVVATSANITLSGEQTINTVAVVEGDRVLVKSQTDPIENGIYNVKTTSWVRATDFNVARDVVNGVLVLDASTGYVYQAFITGEYTPDETEVTFTRNVFSDLQSEQFFYDNHASSLKNAYAIQVPTPKTTPSAYLPNIMVTFRPSHLSDSTTVTLRILGDSGLLSALPYKMEDGSTNPTAGFFTTDRDVTARLSDDMTKWIHVSKKLDVTLPTFTTITGAARDNADLDSELDTLSTADHKFFTNHASSAADVYVIVATVSPKPTEWETGRIYEFAPSHANTGACTVDMHDGSGLVGAKDYKMEDGTDPVADFFIPTEHVKARYDGTKLVHMSGGYQLTAEEVLTTTTINQRGSVRQSLIFAPVTSAGLPNLGGSTGATIVTTSNVTSGAPFVVNSSNGVFPDYIGISTSNLTWTGLSTNGTMYLYVDVSSTGALTTGVTTLAPIYQWGGTPATTSGQCTFNISQMQMFVGNGSSSPQAYRVFVGEVTVAGGVTTTITWYALNSVYIPAWTSTLPGPAVSISVNHNIGVAEGLVATFEVKCNSADLNHSVGDIIASPSCDGGTWYSPHTIRKTYKTAILRTGSTVGTRVQDATSGAFSNPTAAKWDYRITVKRGW